ncbi:MAG TPA: protein kinase [Polyangiales bacterium]|nr:protein kinase [Polyangiales bacterium]
MDEGKGSPIESELAERVGTLINERYRVLRVIGHGSTGAVYACQHVGLDKLVALKVLHREMEQNASFVDRFKLEAQAASRLEHPNSVRVLDFGQDLATGALFIAMEYIEGRDLLQVLEEDGPFTAERAVDVMSQILDVLGVAHQAGIVHRDLKPENILLRTVEVDGVARELVTVCDFGIAQFGGRRSSAAEGTSPDGEEGLVAGTPAYMSPEQARAEPQDARSDVYSAGVVLYQLLTLQLPFYADDAYALALKHCVEVPPPPSRFGAVSPQLEEICLKALSKSRDARYQSAREMRMSLQRVLMATPESSSLHTPLDVSGKPRRWGLPRQLAPQGTPADSPPVEMSPTPAPRAEAAFGRVWRWSLAGVVAVGCVMCAGAMFSHTQDQRASAAGPSTANSRAVSMVRPSRPPTSISNRAGSGSQRSAALSSSVMQSGRTETAYSASSTAPTGAELPEAQTSLPVSSSDSASAEIEELGDSGENARRASGASGAGGSKSTRAHADASRSERRAAEPAHPARVNIAAQEKQEKVEKESVAAKEPVPVKDKEPAATKVSVADKADALSPRAEASSADALDGIDIGLLPDIPIDLSASSAANEPPPPAAVPKATLVSRVSRPAAESNEEADTQGHASPRAAGGGETEGSFADTAHVSITKIASRSGVSKSSVRSALNLAAITDCYRSAIRYGGLSGNRVVGELELATSQSGSVIEASLNAPALPTPLRHCVEQIVRRGRVREADTGNAQATITLAFVPR